jgi:hypothetical protein
LDKAEYYKNLSFIYFLLDQKVAKNQGLTKICLSLSSKFWENKNSSAGWRTQTVYFPDQNFYKILFTANFRRADFKT